MSESTPQTTGSEAFRLLVIARIQRIEREADQSLSFLTRAATPGQKLNAAWDSLRAIRQSARQTLLDLSSDGN